MCIPAVKLYSCTEKWVSVSSVSQITFASKLTPILEYNIFNNHPIIQISDLDKICIPPALRNL